jgi:ribosomal protein L3
VCLLGAVPGARGGVLMVRKSVKQTKAQQRAQGGR